MDRPFADALALNAHFDAEERIPVAQDEYLDALHTLNNRRADRQATRADWDQAAEKAAELARLHSDETDYYTRLVAWYAESRRSGP